MKYLSLITLLVLHLTSFSQNKHLKKANAFLEGGYYAKAIKEYTIVLNSAKTPIEEKAEATLMLGKALYKGSESELAKDIWQSFDNEYGGVMPDDILYMYAHTNAKGGDYYTAESILCRVSNTAQRDIWIESMVDWPLSRMEDFDPVTVTSKTNIAPIEKGLGFAYYDGAIYVPEPVQTNQVAQAKITRYNLKKYRETSYNSFSSQENIVFPKNKDIVFQSTPQVTQGRLIFSSSVIVDEEQEEYLPGHDHKEKNYLKLFSQQKQAQSGNENPTLIFPGQLDANYSFPHLMDESILFFSTDQAGGEGGFDIMYASLTNGRWSKPKKIEGLNSADNEIYPYVFEGDLYFSSKGHPGFGGFDVFVAELEWNGQEVKATSIQNVGQPINSSYDDFSYVPLSADRGYLMSDRLGQSEDDIFWYGVVPTVPDITIRQNSVAADFSQPNEDDTASVVSGELQDLENDAVARSETRAVANASLLESETMIADGEVLMVLEAESDINERPTVVDGAEKTDAQLNDELEFSPTPSRTLLASEPPFVSEKFEPITRGGMIFFELKEQTPESRGMALLDELAGQMIENEELEIALSGYTDFYGSSDFNKKLSKSRAVFCKEFLMDKGIDESRIDIYWYGEENSINTCDGTSPCNPEEIALNRRVEFHLQSKSNSYALKQ